MKKAIKSELEKMKRMNRRDLAWYIAEYYKFHMIGLILVIILVYVVASTAYRMTFRTALHCVCINSRSGEAANLAPLEEDYAAWLGLGKKDLVYAEDLFVSYGDDTTEYGMANLEKLAALTMSQELDVMICDTESLEHFASMGAFLDLEETLPSDLLTACSGRFLTAEGADGSEHAFGLSLSGTPFAADCGLAQEPPIFCIVANTTRLENAVALARFILTQEH